MMLGLWVVLGGPGMGGNVVVWAVCWLGGVWFRGAVHWELGWVWCGLVLG